MGKRIRVQRRGRGAPTFRASTHKRVAPARYPSAIGVKECFDTIIKGVIEDLVHDPGRGSPLALIRFENGRNLLHRRSRRSLHGWPDPDRWKSLG